jgi:hypothetical protein
VDHFEITAFRHLTAQNDVRQLHRLFKAHLGSKHALSFDDCVSLYRLVRKVKPRNVVEFGSGIGTGTGMIAAALRANGGGNVIALEQFAWLRDIAAQLIPADLKPHVEIVVAGTEVREYFGQRWSCYQWQYSGPKIDLALIDGTAEWKDETGEFINLPNGDLIELAPFLPGRAMVFVDGRKSSVAGYQEFLSGSLKLVREKRDHTEFQAVSGQRDPLPAVRNP